MAPKPWSARVFKEDGYWWWDVSYNGLRSTGGRPAWREAYDAAFEELSWLRATFSSPGNP